MTEQNDEEPKSGQRTMYLARSKSCSLHPKGYHDDCSWCEGLNEVVFTEEEEPAVS